MKTKIKIVIGTIITIITCCIFIITSYAQEGYTISDNGNIESLNLFSYFSSWNNESNTDAKNYFNLRISFNNQIDLVVNESYESVGVKNVSFTTPSYLNNMLIKHNGSTRDIDILYLTNLSFLQPNTTYNFSFNLISYNPSINGGLSFDNIMLNIGSSALNYFPYGNYYNNKYTSLYQAFNNANVKLYNLTNNNLILQENINITNSNVYNLQNDTINIANYLNNQEGDNRYYYIIIELNQSINNTLILNTYNDTIEANAKIYSYDQIYSQSYIRQENKDYIQIEATNYYNYIYYDGFYTPDYTRLEISLNIDSINYSRGYNIGYDEGYESGYIEGKASGRTEGAINANSQVDRTSASYVYGYEQGQASSNSLQGMVISIAETPINIFKQIFNFNILGFDITQFLFSIVSLLLVVFLIKKIIK